VGSSKYGHFGNCGPEFLSSLGIPTEVSESLKKWGNMGLARGTWSTYRTAERLWWTCMKENHRRGEMPVTEADTAVFIHWLIEKRKVKVGTINGYLAGIRQMHVVKGMKPPEIRTASMNLVLKGKKNAEHIQARKGEGIRRLPVTMAVMRTLKERLRTWHRSTQTKLLAWSVCTLAFHGAFRAGEILAKEERIFDKDFTLLTEDIKILKDTQDEQYILAVKLKSPKENQTGKAVIVEVYETKGTLCPIRAFLKWRKSTNAETGMPLFRQEDGSSLTSRQLNSWLKELLRNDINYDMGKITSHSFRIGLATTLGTMGFNSDDIKEAGRWSSNAYELYLKLPRVKRAQIAKKIASL
jgi:integrase